MATYDVGGVRVRIEGDADNLQKAAKQTQQALTGLDKSMAGLASTFIKFAAAAAGPAVFAALLKGTLETIDNLEKLSFRLGASVEDMQALRYAAQLADVSFEELARSATMMQGRIAEAARTAKGPAADALARLKINAQEFSKLPIDQKLAQLGDRFKELGLSAAQQLEVLRDFGIRGGALIELLDGGSEVIKKAKQDLADFGVTLSRVDAQKVVQANDAMTTAFRVLEGTMNQVAVRLAPFLFAAANAFAEAARGQRGFSAQMDATFIKFVEFIANMERVLGKFGTNWGEVWQKIGDQAVASSNRMLNTVIPGFSTLSRMGQEAFKRLSESGQTARTDIEKPPEPTEWERAIGRILLISQIFADQESKAREDRRKKDKGDLDMRNREQEEALRQRLTAFKKGLADELTALTFQRDQDLAQLKEFQRQKGISQEDAALLRRQIEEKYLREDREKRNALFFQDTATELEILKHGHQMKLEETNRYLAARQLTEEQAAERRRKLEEKNQLATLQLISKQYSALAGIVDTSMGHISQLIGKEGGAAFEIMKAISMATALVKGFEAVVSAYAAGAAVGGPPLGAAFAAIAAAGVAAQIANLARTKPETAGAGAAAPTGSAAATAGPAAAAGGGPAGSTQTLVVQGLNPSGLFSGSVVRDLADKLVDFQRDGGRVVIQ